MGLNASFFDMLNGKTFDKLYIRKPEEGGYEVFLTFSTDHLIKISSATEMTITFKDEENKIVELKK